MEVPVGDDEVDREVGELDELGRSLEDSAFLRLPLAVVAGEDVGSRSPGMGEDIEQRQMAE